MNIERGVCKSLQYSAVGFAIPAAIIGLIAIYHFTFHEIHPMDRQQDLARLPALILIPSCGLALLFGLAAFGAFTPTNGMSFIRSLIVISTAAMIAVFASRPRVPRKTVDPNAWLETAIPVTVAVIATIVVLLYYRWSPFKNPDGDKPNSKLTPKGEITARSTQVASRPLI